jgi:hypothetical protein
MGCQKWKGVEKMREEEKIYQFKTELAMSSFSLPFLPSLTALGIMEKRMNGGKEEGGGGWEIT